MKIVSAIAAVAITAALPASAENYRVAHFAPQTSYFGGFDEEFAKLVTEATDGEATFEFFWSGSLGSGTEIPQLLAGGAIRIGGSAPAYYPAGLPIAGLTNSLPAVFQSVETAMRVQRKLTTEHPLFLEEAARAGLYPIVQHGLTPMRLMCTDPVSTIADLSGLKVRTYGYFLPVALSALGMTPVSMDITEIYEGLQRGVIDCVALSYASASTYNLEEVAQYWSDINLGAFSGPVLYASHTTYFDAWDDDMRAIVSAASSTVFDKEISALAMIDEQALEKAGKAGVEVVPFTEQAEVEDTLPDMLELWQEKQVSDGMDADVAAEVVAAVRAELGS